MDLVKTNTKKGVKKTMQTKRTNKTINSHKYLIWLKDGTKTANRRPERFETVSDAKDHIWNRFIKGGHYIGEYELIFDIYKGGLKDKEYIATMRTGSTVYDHTIDYD
jgi:hypothetical protein